MKKFILKLDLHDDKDKRKALKTVSTLAGIDSISMDMKGQKLTVVGTVDPITVASKLRKFWPTEIILVGPVKEPEKKEEPKKEEGKKDEGKIEEGKKEEPKKDEPKKEESRKADAKKAEPVVGIMPNRPYYPYMNGMPYPPPVNAMPYPPPVNAMPYRPYYPPPSTYYYPNHSVEENPNGCVIC